MIDGILTLLTSYTRKPPDTFGDTDFAQSDEMSKAGTAVNNKNRLKDLLGDIEVSEAKLSF